MPVLRNQRREIFAQEIAKAKTATEAMAAAGYSHPQNSTRLIKNDEVRRRIDELRKRGAIRAEVSIATIIHELEHSRLLAMEGGQMSAAVAAIMAKAKIAGLITNRTEVKVPDEFASKSKEELVADMINAMAEDIELYEGFLKRARQQRAASMDVVSRH